MHVDDCADDELDAQLVGLANVAVATADGGGPTAEEALTDVLRLIREQLQMDVVFVSQFVGGRAVFRRVDAEPHNLVLREGESHPLEYTFCQRVVDGRLPGLVNNVPARPDAAELPAYDFPVGAYLAVPVRLQDGRVCGVLCCFSFAPSDTLTERDLKRLEIAARLAARVIEETGVGHDANAVPED